MMIMPMERMTRLMQLLNQKPDEPVIPGGMMPGKKLKANM